MAWQGEGNRSHEQDRNRRTGREIADKLPDVRTDESRLEGARVVRRSALPANPRRQRREVSAHTKRNQERQRHAQ